MGKGIYLASEHSKSASYVQPSKNVGIMFLVEAALGNVHPIQQDDSSLVAAPAGEISALTSACCCHCRHLSESLVQRCALQLPCCTAAVFDAGFHSILAKGKTEPDPKQDTQMKLYNCDVAIPQGAPVSQKDATGSSFSQSVCL